MASKSTTKVAGTKGRRATRGRTVAAAPKQRQPPTPRSLDTWLKAGLHLPPILRDSSNQAALFRFLNKVQENGIQQYKLKYPTMPETSARRFAVDLISAHVYVIDTFLWMLAKCGYTLQRTRYPLDQVYDLAATLKAEEEERLKELGEQVKQYADERRKQLEAEP